MPGGVSDPNRALAYKQGGLELLLAYDLTLSGVPPDSVIVQSTGAGLNLHLAEELASLAGAQIASQLVDLQQDAQLAALHTGLEDLAARTMRRTTEHANQLTALADTNRRAALRLDQLANQQSSAHDRLLEIQVASAAAILDTDPCSKRSNEMSLESGIADLVRASTELTATVRGKAGKLTLKSQRKPMSLMRGERLRRSIWRCRSVTRLL